MNHFFTTESTAPPAISILWYGAIILLQGPKRRHRLFRFFGMEL